MAYSPRRRSFHLSVSTAVLFITSSPLVAGAAAADGPRRITAVANATVRSAPSPSAPAIAQLPLGTEVRESGPAGFDKSWVLVRLDDAREGWLQTRLTRPLDAVWRSEAFDAIISERLARQGDGFSASAELVSFIERVAAEYGDPASRARVELARLHALARTAAAIPPNGAKREPYAAWLAARRNDVIYDEPGGRWMVGDETIWNVHAKHRDTPAADEIAWFAVANGLPGECEGYAACYFAAHDRLHGTYLRAHPFGRHAAEAVGAVGSLLDAVSSSGQIDKSYSFDRKDDCRELATAVDNLSSAIRTARVAAWDSTLADLAVLRKLCQ